jgi:cytidine deaminase
MGRKRKTGGMGLSARSRTPSVNGAPNRGRGGVSTGHQRKLIRAAAQARRYAVAPYSRFQVGAAFLIRSGEIITGANVESASYGLTCCAERVALFNALTNGKSNFTAVAIVAPAPGGPMPCGACRQLLAEYAPHALVWVADSRNLRAVKEFSVTDLLPGAFIEVPGVGPAARPPKSSSSSKKAPSARTKTEST